MWSNNKLLFNLNALLIFVQDFAAALCAKVLEHIKLNEPTHQPEKWMANLAISSVHLKEGNTFARSVWLHLVDKVASHLSKVISTCDLFDGLDYLTEGEMDWVKKFYIRMMSAVDLTTSTTTKEKFK